MGLQLMPFFFLLVHLIYPLLALPTDEVHSPSPSPSLSSSSSPSPSPTNSPVASPKSQLRWAPCHLEGLNSSASELPVDCATLPVPLDYTDSDNSDSLQLQLLRVNATKQPILGSVLFNPGGPGSSGVEDVVQSASIYSEYVYPFSFLSFFLFLSLF